MKYLKSGLTMIFAAVLTVGCVLAWAADSDDKVYKFKAVSDAEMVDVLQASMSGNGPEYFAFNFRCVVDPRCPRRPALVANLTEAAIAVGSTTDAKSEELKDLVGALKAFRAKQERALNEVCPCRPLLFSQ